MFIKTRSRQDLADRPIMRSSKLLQYVVGTYTKTCNSRRDRQALMYVSRAMTNYCSGCTRPYRVTLKSKLSGSLVKESWYKTLWYRSSDFITDITPLVSYQTSCSKHIFYALRSDSCIPRKMSLIRYERLRAFGSTLARTPAPSNPLLRSKPPITHSPQFFSVMDGAQTKSIAASRHFTKILKPDLLSPYRSRIATQRIVSLLTMNRHFGNSALT